MDVGLLTLLQGYFLVFVCGDLNMVCTEKGNTWQRNPQVVYTSWNVHFVVAGCRRFWVCIPQKGCQVCMYLSHFPQLMKKNVVKYLWRSRRSWGVTLHCRVWIRRNQVAIQGLTNLNSNQKLKNPEFRVILFAQWVDANVLLKRCKFVHRNK